VAGDLQQAGEGARTLDAAEAAHGAVDVLVNSAGAAQRRPAPELTPQYWHDAMNAKYFTYIHMIDPVIKRMAQRGAGAIVNIVGNGGKVANPTHIAGGAANAALMLASAGLASAYASQGVRVNAVNPGPTATDRLIKGLTATARADGISSGARRAGRWPSCWPLLGMLGPFSIDTYLPAFAGIAIDRCLAGRNAADAVGLSVRVRVHEPLPRRAVRQLRAPAGGAVGLAVFTVASVGCALSQTSMGSWCSSVRCRACPPAPASSCRGPSSATCFPPAGAAVMSQVTIYFGVAPAVAPMVGGWLFVHAGLAQHLLVPDRRGRAAVRWPTGGCCPRPCTSTQRQPFNVRHLMRGYLAAWVEPALPACWRWPAACPFNGMFLYVLSAPAFLGDILKLAPSSSSGSSCSPSPASWRAPG
jgi:hypothetical protein